jgi:hypothetical protein
VAGRDVYRSSRPPLGLALAWAGDGSAALWRKALVALGVQALIIHCARRWVERRRMGIITS